MGAGGFSGWLGRQEWMEPVERVTQKAVSRTAHAAGDTTKDFLHGTWLGHPLHAAIVHLPIGAWTVALIMDALDVFDHREPYEDGARAAIAMGIGGALGSAMAGLADWSDVDPPARRIGLLHAVLNVAGVGMFTASYMMRRKRALTTGKLLALAGYATAGFSAWLGGNLVYHEKIGVDHTAGQPLPDDWVAVMDEHDLPEGQPRKVNANGAPVMLVRRGYNIDALYEKCAHLGGPLSEGRLEGDTIKCPWHGSTYSIKDGHVIHGPSQHPQPRLETRVRNGQIEVRKATGAPKVMTA